MGFDHISWPRVQYDYSGTTVIVTGGTSGIGAAIAKCFATAGASVTVSGTRSSADDYESSELANYHYLPLDLANPESIRDFTDQLTSVDILVNNGGGTGGAQQPFDFDTSVYVNLNSAWHLSNQLTSKLAQSSLERGASIVNLASEMSLYGSPYFPGYGAGKAGIVQLTKTLAKMFADQAIRCNAVLPGSVSTKMTAAFAENTDIHDAVSSRTPMGRWGEPDEIAAAVLFLSSPSAGFITGHTLVVDGGYSVIDS
ncbi:MAG: SDR family NAD(P)-dependent oxidoreductase [Pseudomonadales bacterium]